MGLQFPKWKLIWECEGSFLHTFLHSQQHEMWLPGSLLACTFVSPRIGHKPKSRVVTIIILEKQNPLNGEKKHMEKTKYLYFSWTFDIVAKHLFLN